MSIHGHEVRYLDVGEGPVILLIHGLAGDWRSWRGAIRGLARNHRVLVPDLLGHGASAKPRGDYSIGAYASSMRDLLGVLGVDRATVIGQSFGGGVAMQLAYQHPETCERLVLVDSGGFGREVTALLRAFTIPGIDLLLPVLCPGIARHCGDRISRFVVQRGVRAPNAAEMWLAYRSLTYPDTRRAFVRTLRSVIDIRGQSMSAYDRIYLADSVPTLIVWGGDDPIIPVGHGRLASAAMPGSTLVVFEGVGHFPHVEEPKRFVATVLEFLATTEPTVSDPAKFRARLREYADGG